MSGAISETRRRSAPPEADRFYPSSIAPFAGEPRRSDFSIGHTCARKGLGVIANLAFQKGDLLFVFAGSIVTEITQFSLQLAPGVHVDDPFFMGKVLHSCEPNAECYMATREFRAVRDIVAGELVTMDYDATEEQLFRAFQCACGAATCRGWIAGS